MNSKTKGILCIVTAAFCFAFMSLCVRLAGDLPSMQKIWSVSYTHLDVYKRQEQQ